MSNRSQNTQKCCLKMHYVRFVSFKKKIKSNQRHSNTKPPMFFGIFLLIILEDYLAHMANFIKVAHLINLLDTFHLFFSIGFSNYKLFLLGNCRWIITTLVLLKTFQNFCVPTNFLGVIITSTSFPKCQTNHLSKSDMS